VELNPNSGLGRKEKEKAEKTLATAKSKPALAQESEL
jgi:hypothetical protein